MGWSLQNLNNRLWVQCGAERIKEDKQRDLRKSLQGLPKTGPYVSTKCTGTSIPIRPDEFPKVCELFPVDLDEVAFQGRPSDVRSYVERNFRGTRLHTTSDLTCVYAATGEPVNVSHAMTRGGGTNFACVSRQIAPKNAMFEDRGRLAFFAKEPIVPCHRLTSMLQSHMTIARRST
jgi:hypothetical protein